MQHQQSQQANGFGVFSASSPSLAANNSNGGGDGGGGQGGGGNNTMGDEDDDRENKIRIVAKLEKVEHLTKTRRRVGAGAGQFGAATNDTTTN